MTPFSTTFTTMGGPASIQFYAKTSEKASQIMDIVYQELNRLNSWYSNYSPHSFVAKINHCAGNKNGIVVDDETAVLLDYAHACYQLSNGLFDITAGILFKAWDFDSPNPSLPSSNLLTALLQKVGWEKVIWQKPHLILPLPGMTLDFGGVVKEYAADRVVALCRQHGIDHGIIELGGDIAIIGPKPDGSPWYIGINDPFNPSQSLFSLELASGSVATSGDYARFIEIGGLRYCHILNPLTGRPIQNVGSVSVVADQCLVAGSCSTIAFLMEQKGVDWLKNQNARFAFVGNDKSLAYNEIDLIQHKESGICNAA